MLYISPGSWKEGHVKFKRLLAAAVVFLLAAFSVTAGDWTVSQKEARKIMFGREVPPSNANLSSIVCGAQLPADAETAWGMLAPRAWNSEDYAMMVCSSPEPYRGKAWDRLLAEPPTALMLLRVLKCAGPSHAKELWARLEKLEVPNDALAKFVRYADEPYRGKAWDRLTAQKPTLRDLQLIYNYGESDTPYKRAAWELAWVEATPSDADLENILYNSGRHYAEGNAAWRLLKPKVTRRFLVQLVTKAGGYSNDAWEELYAIGPSAEDIREIVASERLDKDFRLMVAKIGLDRECIP